MARASSRFQHPVADRLVARLVQRSAEFGERRLRVPPAIADVDTGHCHGLLCWHPRPPALAGPKDPDSLLLVESTQTERNGQFYQLTLTGPEAHYPMKGVRQRLT